MNERTTCCKYLLLSIAILGVLALWAVGFVPLALYGVTSTAGVFGDSFGIANALLSGFSFLALLITLWLQREEMESQRKADERQEREISDLRTAEQASEKRRLLTAYMNTLDALQRYAAWRIGSDPARYGNATYPVVEGMITQQRVSETLQRLVRELEPEMIAAHPTLREVTEEGSFVWVLEALLAAYINLNSVRENYSRRKDDTTIYPEVCNMVRVQVVKLRELVGYVRPQFRDNLKRLVDDYPPTEEKIYESMELERGRFFNGLAKQNGELLALIMGLMFK